MVQLILVRHGQPDVPATGHTGNPPLSERGHAQAAHAARVLQQEKIDRIVSSGMTRADATAQPLADAMSRAIERHADLGEIDRYGGEYASIDAIRQKGPEEWRRFMAAPLTYLGVDGVRFRSETLSAFERLTSDADGLTIAVFTHGFPINIVLSHALGLNHDARFAPQYASITRLAGRSFDALTVISLNETGHLPEALR